eukprot:30918-Pelagococcus_subviridis.AAC.17
MFSEPARRSAFNPRCTQDGDANPRTGRNTDTASSSRVSGNKRKTIAGSALAPPPFAPVHTPSSPFRAPSTPGCKRPTFRSSFASASSLSVGVRLANASTPPHAARAARKASSCSVNISGSFLSSNDARSAFRVRCASRANATSNSRRAPATNSTSRVRFLYQSLETNSSTTCSRRLSHARSTPPVDDVDAVAASAASDAEATFPSLSTLLRSSFSSITGSGRRPRASAPSSPRARRSTAFAFAAATAAAALVASTVPPPSAIPSPPTRRSPPPSSVAAFLARAVSTRATLRSARHRVAHTTTSASGRFLSALSLVRVNSAASTIATATNFANALVAARVAARVRSSTTLGGDAGTRASIFVPIPNAGWGVADGRAASSGPSALSSLASRRG